MLLETHYTIVNYIEIVVIVLMGLVGMAAGIERVIGWFTGGQKARDAAIDAKLKELADLTEEFVSGDALEKRFEGIESKQKLMASEQMNQHNTLHEFERERERLKGELGTNLKQVDGSIKQLQKDVLALEPMPGRVANLEAKFDALNERIGSLKEGVQELKNDVKDNKREILDAIKNLPH